MNLMTFLRPTKYTWKIFTSLLIIFVIICVLAGYSNDTFGPLLIFLIFGPLSIADSINLPVYESFSGTWFSGPSLFGLVFLVIFYGLVLYLLSSFISRILESRKK